MKKFPTKAKVVVAACALLGIIGAGIAMLNNNDRPSVDEDISYSREMELASTTPFGKYPEKITYTLGKLTGVNKSNMPDGDTYEDNAYTRYLANMLNIQNVNVFEANDNQYDTTVSLAIASGKIPDVMVVSSLEDLSLLVKMGMIEDLSSYYDKCMSATIKDIYNSYDGILDVATFNGRLMAIPETNIDDGPNLVWLRKDWMDKLGLEEPKTIYDVEYIVEQFIKQDPGNNGANGTVGLVSDTSLCGECGYSSEYLLDTIFATFNSYPKQWIYDDKGNVVYGSVQQEAKDALKHINEIYNKGILDKSFLLRTNSNIIDLITSGKCGSFFGPWWAPNNPLMKAVENNPEADWQPYLLATNEDGSTSYHSQNPTYKFVVVRKGYEHPEIVCKMLSVMFDYIRYIDDYNDEFVSYYQQNVDPTARPLAINVDYENALSLCYNEINKALNDDKYVDKLHLLEYSYYKSCKSYLGRPEKATSDDWAAYTSRITACSLLSKGNVKKIQSLFFGETDTMVNEWWQLKDSENQAYLKIITGDEGIDYFDEFVSNWNENGGKKITEEVRQEIASK